MTDAEFRELERKCLQGDHFAVKRLAEIARGVVKPEIIEPYAVVADFYVPASDSNNFFLTGLPTRPVRSDREAKHYGSQRAPVSAGVNVGTSGKHGGLRSLFCARVKTGWIPLFDLEGFVEAGRAVVHINNRLVWSGEK